MGDRHRRLSAEISPQEQSHSNSHVSAHIHRDMRMCLLAKGIPKGLCAYLEWGLLRLNCHGHLFIGLLFASVYDIMFLVIFSTGLCIGTV